MKFPVEKLIPIRAEFSDKNGLEEFIIEFSDFYLPDPFDIDGEQLKFESPIRADSADLKILPTNPLKLKGKTFNFPVNPKNGYIDASIYFGNVHNPIDISKMEFGIFDGEKIPLKITTKWLFSFEGTGFEDFEFVFDVPLFVEQAPKESPLKRILNFFVFK